jgi:hypothetical protein
LIVVLQVVAFFPSVISVSRYASMSEGTRSGRAFCKRHFA